MQKWCCKCQCNQILWQARPTTISPQDLPKHKQRTPQLSNVHYTQIKPAEKSQWWSWDTSLHTKAQRLAFLSITANTFLVWALGQRGWQYADELFDTKSVQSSSPQASSAASWRPPDTMTGHNTYLLWASSPSVIPLHFYSVISTGAGGWPPHSKPENRQEFLQGILDK